MARLYKSRFRSLPFIVSTKVDTHQQQRETHSTGKLSKAGWVRLRGCPRHGCRGQAPMDGFT
ncbi:hypothetical protein JY430_20930, partial [Stenotrophomonas maltophilia]|nr:hypothetical protein [Stenotrophomonas maltophilia]